MKPLAGIRVIEIYDPDGPLALCLAGAFAGRLLADLGADVLYEEQGSARLKQIPPIVGNTSALFSFLQAGKTAIPASDTQRDKVLTTADAAIVDISTHCRLGLSVTSRAVVLLTLHAEDTPDAQGSEFTIMALSGILDIVGDPNRQPLKLGGHQGAYSTGLAAFTGLLSALCLTRNGHAATETVRVSMLETLLWINWKSAVAVDATNEAPFRRGSSAEWQVLRCADGYIAVVYQPEDWPALQTLIADDRLKDPCFSTAALRLANGQALAAIIEAGLSRFTREEIRNRALAARLPLGPVWTLAELVHDRHYMARHVFSPTVMPDGRTALMHALPLTWNGLRFNPGLIPS